MNIKWLKNFLTDKITVVACIMLILVIFTLWNLKYRPCVIAGVSVESIPGKPGCAVFIVPNNVGSCKCKVKLSKIRLCIGDEAHDIPDTNWITLNMAGVVRVPAGYASEADVKKIQQNNFSKGHIELFYTVETKSMEDRYQESKPYILGINVSGERPVARFRLQ